MSRIIIPNYNPNSRCNQPVNTNIVYFGMNQKITEEIHYLEKNFKQNSCYCSILPIIAFLNSMQSYLLYQQSKLYISTTILYADILSCSLSDILSQLTSLAQQIIALGNLPSTQTLFFYYSTNQSIKYIYNYQNVPSNFNITTLEPLSENIGVFQINSRKTNFFAIESGNAGIAFENAYPYYYTVWQKWMAEPPLQNVFIEAGVLFPLCSLLSPVLSSSCFDNPFLQYVVLYSDPPIILIDYTPVGQLNAILSTSERIIYPSDGNQGYTSTPIGIAYYDIQLFCTNPDTSEDNINNSQYNKLLNIPSTVVPPYVPNPNTATNTQYQGKYTTIQIFQLNGYIWYVYKSGELFQTLVESYSQTTYTDSSGTIYSTNYAPGNIAQANILSSVVDGVIQYNPQTQKYIQFQNVGSSFTISSNFLVTTYQLDFLKAIATEPLSQPSISF